MASKCLNCNMSIDNKKKQGQKKKFCCGTCKESFYLTKKMKQEDEDGKSKYLTCPNGLEVLNNCFGQLMRGSEINTKFYASQRSRAKNKTWDKEIDPDEFLDQQITKNYKKYRKPVAVNYKRETVYDY